MVNYKYENGNYYRQSSNKKWFKVDRNDDGYLTWKQPDGQEIIDKSFKVPAFMQVSNGRFGPVYTFSNGANGSIGRYFSFNDAAKAYTQAVDRGAYGDPSENAGNDLMFDVLAGIRGFQWVANGIKAIPTALKSFAKSGKHVINTGRKIVTKQVPKEVAKRYSKQVAKKIGNTILLEVPKFEASIVGGLSINGLSKATTGHTWGENVANSLTNRWKTHVSPFVGELTNPGYYVGYKVGNWGLKELLKDPYSKSSVIRTTPIQETTLEPSTDELANALRNTSEEDLRALLNRLRTETTETSAVVETPIAASEELLPPPIEIHTVAELSGPPVTETTTVQPNSIESIAQMLRNARVYESNPGEFIRGRAFDLHHPNDYWAVENGQARQLNLLNPNDIQGIINYELTPLNENMAKLIARNPHVQEYKYTGDPFTLETLPGLNRTELVETFDKTHMAHFPDNPVLNSEGYLTGHTVNSGKSYEQVMATELDKVPHGASIGFNTNGSTSTSSTPMFWLQLRRNLQNNSLARIYIPTNSPRYTLNSFGRAYQLNKKGRMVSVPGTEGNAFSIPYKPEYIGVKNMKYTLEDGTQRNILQLPDGTYYGKGGKSVIDISDAFPAYYNNGSIYDGISHKVLYSVDQPFLTKQQFIDHLNSEYILPTLKAANITAEPAKLVGRDIEVPSIAGIKFKEGGQIIQRFRKCRKN